MESHVLTTDSETRPTSEELGDQLRLLRFCLRVAIVLFAVFLLRAALLMPEGAVRLVSVLLFSALIAAIWTLLVEVVHP